MERAIVSAIVPQSFIWSNVYLSYDFFILNIELGVMWMWMNLLSTVIFKSLLEMFQCAFAVNLTVAR